MRAQALFLGGPLALATMSGGLTASARDSADAAEVAEIRARNPHAVALLEQGEALLATGRAQDAEALFRQAHTDDPAGSILWRRDCEALTALGKRDEATTACATAVGAWRSAGNLRALVSALVDGPVAPTTVQLSQALQIVAHEHHFGPSIAAAAAACDIAERIGDDVMLQGCARELERINPDHPATREAFSRLDARCPPWRFWAGWGAIFAAIVATLAHALSRRLGGLRSRRASVTAVALLSIAVGSLARPASADDKSNWLSKRHIDEEDPAASMPDEKERNADPLEFGYWIQDVALKGEHASKRGNHETAARDYEALIKAVPDRAIGYIKACEEYEAMGAIDRAINLCGEALLADGTRVKDFTHFAHLVIGKPGKLSDNEVGALARVVAQMKEDPAGRPFVDDLECEVGTRTSNVAQLKECTAALATRAPNDPKTISYEWALAVASGDSRAAAALVSKASAAGVAPASIDRMTKETANLRTRSALRITAITAAVGLFLAGIAVALRSILARRRLAIPSLPGASQPSV